MTRSRKNCRVCKLLKRHRRRTPCYWCSEAQRELMPDTEPKPVTPERAKSQFDALREIVMEK
jgi:hypothetical protein